MNSLRNSSDHAMTMAVVLLVVILALGSLAYFALKGTKFDSGAKPPGLEFRR